MINWLHHVSSVHYILLVLHNTSLTIRESPPARNIYVQEVVLGGESAALEGFIEELFENFPRIAML